MRIKYACVLLLTIQFVPALWAETTTGVLSDVDHLMAEKKYLSAFQVLNRQENGDSNPEIVLRKVDLALNYFVTSIMHQTFTFKDLEKDEDIMDFRGAPGVSTLCNFDVEKVLTPLIKENPGDGRLHVALADYYIEVYEKYRGRWLKSDEEILKNARVHYDEAAAIGDLDGETYFRAGKTALYLKDLPGATERFEVAVRKLTDYAPARYNLAYAYLFQNKPAEAVPYAVAAYELYTEIPLKADAAMLAGQAYGELGKSEEALKYFLLCDEIAPNKFENMRRLLGLFVKSGRSLEAKAVGERIFQLGPDKPAMSQAILSNYIGSALEGEIQGIFKELASKYSGNPMASGNALYHLSLFYLQTGQNALALETLDEAEKYFRKSVKEDHVVFKAMDQIRQNARQPAQTEKQ